MSFTTRFTYRFVFTNLVICLIALKLIQVDSLVVKMRTINCDVYNQTRGEFTVCRIQALSRIHNTLSVHLKVKEIITSANMRLRLYKRANGWKPFLYDSKVDFCNFLATKKKFPVMNWFFNVIASYTNLNHTCPYNHDIIVHKFRPMNATFLPFPYGEYLLDTQWVTNGKSFARFNFSVLFAEF